MRSRHHRGAFVRWLARERLLRVFLLLGPVLLGALVLSPDATWVGWWQRTAVVIHVAAAIVLGAISSAIAAWTVATARTRGFQPWEATAARSSLAITVRRLTPLWVTAIGTYLVLQTVAYIRTALSSPGTPTWPVVIMTIALITVAVAYGALVGSFVNRVVAGILAPLTLYLAMAAPVYVNGGEEGFGRLLPVIQQPGWDPWLQASVPRILAATLWLTCASLTLLVAASSRPPNLRLPSPANVAIVIAAFAAGALCLAPRVPDGHAFVDLKVATPDNHQCRPVGQGQVCVWNSEQDLLDVYATAYTKLSRAGNGLVGMPEAIVEAGLDQAYPDAAWSFSFERHPSAHQIAGDSIESFMVSAEFLCQRDAEKALGGEAWFPVLTRVLMQRGNLPAPPFSQPAPADSPAVKAILGLQDPEQMRWLITAQQAFIACKNLPPIPSKLSNSS